MKTVEVSDLMKSYKDKEVLKGITMSINQDEIFSILGRNGAGKTTTIKILSTLLRYDSGKLLLLGSDPYKNLNQTRRRIGYVGQDTERSAYARLTVEENLKFFGRMMGLAEKVINNRIDMLSESFEFKDRLKVQFMKLSGGQKQTMIIMRALMHDPDLLFLDEPTKGLDPVMAHKLRIFLKNYIKENGKSMLLTSHILPEVEDLADIVSFMKDGRIVFMDTPENACKILGYKDIIEIKSGYLSGLIKNTMLSQPENCLIDETSSGDLIFGTNDFFKAFDVMRGLNDAQKDIEFRHRKTSLEDAYLYFTKTKLTDEYGGDSSDKTA